MISQPIYKTTSSVLLASGDTQDPAPPTSDKGAIWVLVSTVWAETKDPYTRPDQPPADRYGYLIWTWERKSRPTGDI